MLESGSAAVLAAYKAHHAHYHPGCNIDGPLIMPDAPHPQPDAPTEEYAWLIEFPGPPTTWWNCSEGETGTLDANDAVRFARREDAERVMHYLIRRPAIVTEHGWFHA